jgi:hypothetical protein
VCVALVALRDQVWDAHYKGVTCLGLTGDGAFLVSGSEDTTAKVWALVDVLDADHEEARLGGVTSGERRAGWLRRFYLMSKSRAWRGIESG